MAAVSRWASTLNLFGRVCFTFFGFDSFIVLVCVSVFHSVHQPIYLKVFCFALFFYFNVRRWRCDPRTRLWSGSWWSFTPASRSSSRNYLRRKRQTRRKLKRKRGAAPGTLRVRGEAAASTAAQGKWAFPSLCGRRSRPLTRGFHRRGRSAGEALCREDPNY